MLGMKDKYPRDISFGKRTLHIQKVYYENDKLFIVIPKKEPEEITLRIDDQNYNDLIVTDTRETVTFDFPVKKKDSYDLLLSGLDREESIFEGIIPTFQKRR